MKTLLKWFGLVFALMVARILPALIVLAVIVFLLGQGLQSLGLQVPSRQQIAQRIDAARADFAPLLARIRAATAPPPSTNSAPDSGTLPAQSAP